METTTFAEFIHLNHISIPLIQRDYIQGRYSSDIRREEKRTEFVQKLLDALLPGGQKCTLDFIYGAKDNFGVESDSKQDDTPFLPLDGQQRLTTLFLLHWCILQKAKPLNDTEKEVVELYCQRINDLAKFAYQTRISSGRFCAKLVASEFKPAQLVSQIQAMYWYDNEMKLDPTVQAMIQMLTLLEKNIEEEKYNPYLFQMLDNLYMGQSITFDILDMEKYNLTDGLYVKMNARGKELTQFENWKADFISLLADNEDDKDRFVQGIEHEWGDVFWKYAYNEYDKNKRSAEGMPVQYPRIDERFMNFFNNTTRLLYFIYTDSKDPKADDCQLNSWKFISEIYKNEDIRHDFFDTLDFVSKINAQHGGIEAFLSELFYNSPSTSWEEQTPKVRLYSDGDIKLFDIICRQSDEFKYSHSLLYFVILYCRTYGVVINDNIRNYLRVCRNYLEEHNYFDTSEVTISPQIRANDMGKYYKAVRILLSKEDPIDVLSSLPQGADDYLVSESKKVKFYKDLDTFPLVRKIEDMSYTHGNLNAFYSQLTNCLSNRNECKNTWNAIWAFEKASPYDKVRLFVSLDYKGLVIKDCAYGKAVFIGGEYSGTSRWMVHFRKNVSKDKKHPLDSWFKQYVQEYNTEGSVSALLKKYEVQTPVSPKDYFLKYQDILAAQVIWRSNIDQAPFYYAMSNPWEDLDIITIHSFSSSPLNRAYQICPMVNAVCRSLPDFKKYKDAGRLGCIGQSASKAGIYFNRNKDWNDIFFSLNFGKIEWRIEKEHYDNLPDILKQYFSYIKEDEEYYILNNSRKDLIADAVSFLELAIKEFSSAGML